MKKNIALFFCLLAFSALKAQFLIHAGPSFTYNHSPFFKAFRDEYNTVNAATITDMMGNPAMGYGFQTGLSFRIFNMQSSIGYGRFRSKTHAEFQSGGKRIISYTYRNFIVNAGGFFEVGLEDALSIELGMVLCGVDQYSYVLLPNKEISYTYGPLSQLNHWLNLGMNFRLGYDHALNDFLSWHTGLTYYFVNNEKEFAPGIELNGTRATLTFKGIECTTGLMLNIGERM